MLQAQGDEMVKFLIETGSESHTTSWQKCQAKFHGGSKDGTFLYQDKASIISTEWGERNKHQSVVKTVYELPEGTEVTIDYSGFQGPEKFIIRLDSAQEVQEQEIGTSRLRTYTMKGRYTVIRDLVKSAEESLKASQQEGF
jgi:hypothetical protein